MITINKYESRELNEWDEILYIKEKIEPHESDE